MKTTLKRLATFVAALSLSTVVYAAQFSGLVIGVTDGDTIKVLDDKRKTHTIRLAGIDAPEFKQAFGRVSRQTLVDLLGGKTVTVVTHKLDRYKREVGKVLHDGNDVNLKQIELGMAWFYRDYQRELSTDDRRLYDEAEKSAKSSSAGLWRDAKAIPPWTFRKQAKS